jgi:hypothetical protein
MKAFAFVFVTFLSFTVASISTANAGYPRTGTAFEIAQQYTDGGKLGGITSGKTGTTLDVARDSLRFLGSVDRIASTWPAPPVLAKDD